MFENIGSFFKKIMKNEPKELLIESSPSKDAAKERLHVVLMQDRANVSADFLELMKEEMLDVIKKYIVVDEAQIDVRLTNQENEDGTMGPPSLQANIPILNIRNDIKCEIFKDSENVSGETTDNDRTQIIQLIKEELNLDNSTDSEKDTDNTIKIDSVETVFNDKEEDKVQGYAKNESEISEEKKIEEMIDSLEEDDDDDVTFDDLLKAAEEEERLKKSEPEENLKTEENKKEDKENKDEKNKEEEVKQEPKKQTPKSSATKKKTSKGTTNKTKKTKKK